MVEIVLWYFLFFSGSGDWLSFASLSELLPCAIAADPLYRLEHEKDDKRRATSRKTVLTRLTELKDAQAKDDYSANAFLRQKMRVGKRKDREKKEESKVNREEVTKLLTGGEIKQKGEGGLAL